MENGSITEVEILDASHETRQFLRRAKRLLTTVVEAQSWEVDAVSEATYTSRGILGAVQNALTGEVVNNPLPPQPEPAAPLVVEEFTAPSTYLDGIYTADPEKDPTATKFHDITYDEVLKRGLKVMDLTATCMCKENNLPIIVFDMDTVGNLKKVMQGEEIGTLVHN